MNAMKYKDHPLAEIFPLMPYEEIAALAHDITDHGVKSKITLYEGKILDGRNRYRACEIAGVEPKFVEFDGDDALAHVVSLNLHRRQLTAGQRAMVAEKLATFERGGDRKGDQTANLQIEKAAKLLNVSARSVEKARSVAKSSPSKAAEVAAGKKTLNKATAEIEAEAKPAKNVYTDVVQGVGSYFYKIDVRE